MRWRRHARQVQAFPETGYGWHLGKTGSGYMNRHSIGIEICSIGYLDDEYKSYVGKRAIESQVIELETPFYLMYVLARVF